MTNGVPYVVLGVGLLAGTFIAYGQTPSRTLVAQAPITAPPSGVLGTQPAAPVGMPPSGVLKTLPPVGPPVVTARPVEKAQKVQTAKGAIPVRTRRHMAHWRSATARRETITRTTTADQEIAVAPSIVSTAPEQPPNDRTVFDSFLLQFGKEKEAK
jgi:hypothetical protein